MLSSAGIANCDACCDK